MLFGTMATIGQATGRIPVLFGFPEGAFGTAGPIPLAFPLVLVVHDLWSENRVHRATIWGLVFMACCLALAPIVGRSSLGSRILDALR